MAELTTQPCPSCGATILVERGYVTWCEHCSWNVVAPPVEAPRTRFERLYAAAGRRAGESLAEELLRAETLAPRFTPARFAAYAIAAAVHLTTLAFFAVGLYFALATFPNVFGILIGIVVALPGFLMAPRLGKVDKDAVVVDRGTAPTLYAFCDEVAAAVDVKPVDILIIDDDYNASWSVVGWRRRRVLRLGLPLLTALGPRERVALVAHEFAHAKNGDAARSFVVGGALGALIEIYRLLHPHRNPSGADVLVNWMFAVFAQPVSWLIDLEFHLLRRDSQRAEYLADALAAETAGSAAVVALHEKLLLTPTFRGVVQHATRGGGDLFDELRRAVEVVPPRERERRRRVARLEESRLADTHPPTGRRIELLERRTQAPGRVMLELAESEAIDRELSPLRAGAQETLIDRYRASVYHR